MILDRRRFLAAGAMAGVAGGLGFWAGPRVAYAVGDRDRVCVFAEAWSGWRLVETVRSPMASGLTVSPDRRMVYVGNAVDGFAGRPSGAVEAFAVSGDGRLRRAGQVGLGLFGHGPERLAVSPHGRWLAVGLAGGGYRLLGLGEDGLPGDVVSSLRRIGDTGGGALRFAANELLVNFSGGKREAVGVGEDGALRFVEGGRTGSAFGWEGLPVGLVRALEEAGVEEQGAVMVG